MIYEDLRAVHEDVERLEDAVAERLIEDPKHIRSRLIRDHEVANFLERIQDQSQRGLRLYNEHDDRTKEIQQISTGDTFSSFYAELQQMKDFHKRNPNEPVENTERKYKHTDREGNVKSFAGDIDAMFTGEEAFGRFFDLTLLHEEFLNLPGVRNVRRYTYLQYLDIFDSFTPPKCIIVRDDKMTDAYFSYVGSLAQYLESFMRKIKPLEDLSKVFSTLYAEFEKEWNENATPGWAAETSQAIGAVEKVPVTEGTGEGVWCADCHKEFSNDNVYKAHLGGKKHKKNAEARKQQNGGAAETAKDTSTNGSAPATFTKRIKERAVAEREHRIRGLCVVMKTERDDTRVNVERKQGMTDKERQQELAALYEEDNTGAGKDTSNPDEEEEEEKVYNPLKLPLAWDGKPIPFWLYKLHGLGVEFPCEICGNFVYMGRRAFDKHFSESRHMYGLSCLGVDKHTGLFREITKIEEAEKLWAKLQHDKEVELEKKGGEDGADIVEMEDSEGNILSYKTWYDLDKLGLV